MLKNRISWMILLLAFILCGNVLHAQVKKQDKKPDVKEEVVEPIKQDKPKGPEKLMLYSGEYFKIQLYGFIKFDAVYNTTDVSHESSPIWVENQKLFYNPVTSAFVTPTSDQPLMTMKKTASQRNGAFVMDMRTTRLGLKMTGPKVLLADTAAQIEIDFLGTAAFIGSGERSPMPELRHAFLQFNWPSGTSLMIGQNWTIAMASSAQPMITDQMPLIQLGNYIQREPQIALGQKVGNDKFNVTLEAAAARCMAGSDTSTSTDLYPGVKGVVIDERGPGEASKVPGGRARLTFVIKPIDLLSITLGGTAHYQLEKHQFTFAGLTNTAIWRTAILSTTQQALLTNRWGRITKSYSALAFGKINISLVTLVAVYWRGNNMDTFCSGLGSGTGENYSGTKILGIPVQGGYGQVQLDLRKIGPIPLAFCLAYAEIKKSNKRYVYNGQLLKNNAILATVFWYLNDYINVGFEFGKHESKWKGVLGSPIDYKYHGHVLFTF